MEPSLQICKELVETSTKVVSSFVPACWDIQVIDVDSVLKVEQADHVFCEAGGKRFAFGKVFLSRTLYPACSWEVEQMASGLC